MIVVAGPPLVPPAVTLAAAGYARPVKLDCFLSVRDVFDLAAGVLAARVTDGRMTLGEFEAAMRQLVKETHVAAYATGRSGRWASIEPAEWRRVERTVEGQYHYLRGFERWIAAGVDVTESAVTARARLYGAAATQSLERGALADLGLHVEMPAYPGDGSTSCLVNCRCRWAVRTLSKARGDFEASWRLGRAEHCRECRRRADVWRRLKVRGGTLVSGYEVEGCFR